VVGQDLLVVFRRYQPSDNDQVAALWSRINRELAPAGMEQIFEQYIATTISGELVRLSEVFSHRGFYRFAEVLYPEMIGEHVRARRFLRNL
jgi:hypothetical protein